MSIETIFETKTYQYYRDSRGGCKTAVMRTNPTKREIKEWQEKQEEFEWAKQIISFLRGNLVRAANRDSAQEISIDLDYLFEVGEQQGWQCALTGDDLEFTRGGTYWGGKWCNPYSCTIDRIDSNKGYVEGNIQLVTWYINSIKGNTPNQDFIEICKSVARYNR